jgi:hypothetical protein
MWPITWGKWPWLNPRIGIDFSFSSPSIVPGADIGITVSHDFRVNDDELIIDLETTIPAGEFITGPLASKRIS